MANVQVHLLDGHQLTVDENDRLADSSVQSLNGVTAGTVAASKYIKADANGAVATVKTAALSIGTSGSETLVVATGAELNRAADVSGRLVAGGAALSLTEALHDGKTVLFDTAAGTTLTLPAATGSGAKFRCVVSVLATSNSHILKVVGNDIMQGSLGIIDTDSADATVFFATETDSDTITFNRTTTGLAEIGAWIEVQDIKADTWSVVGVAQASGSVATPFSAAVS